MSYMHIPNLYADQDILLFKECYATEKIHGCTSWFGMKDGKIFFHAGGVPHENFIKLFTQTELEQKFN